NALELIDCLLFFASSFFIRPHYFFGGACDNEGSPIELLKDSEGCSCFNVMYSCLLPFFPALISSALSTCLLFGSTSSRSPSSTSGTLWLARFAVGCFSTCLLHSRTSWATVNVTARKKLYMERGSAVMVTVVWTGDS
ncbi:hypothetical protein PFISCL1PPCAC_20897, partial [Pristionchus fissidentatus]